MVFLYQSVKQDYGALDVSTPNQREPPTIAPSQTYIDNGTQLLNEAVYFESGSSQNSVAMLRTPTINARPPSLNLDPTATSFPSDFPTPSSFHSTSSEGGPLTPNDGSPFDSQFASRHPSTTYENIRHYSFPSESPTLPNTNYDAKTSYQPMLQPSLLNMQDPSEGTISNPEDGHLYGFNLAIPSASHESLPLAFRAPYSTIPGDFKGPREWSFRDYEEDADLGLEKAGHFVMNRPSAPISQSQVSHCHSGRRGIKEQPRRAGRTHSKRKGITKNRFLEGTTVWYKVEDQSDTLAIKKEKCSHPGCTLKFARREHLGRHRIIHGPPEYIYCPICPRKLKNRLDNLTPHFINTHCTPTEKSKKGLDKKGSEQEKSKINPRWTMREMAQTKWNDESLSEWFLFLRVKDSNITEEEVNRLIREKADKRWAPFLNGKLTLDYMPITKSTAKKGPPNYWKLLGWTVEEAMNTRVIDIAPEYKPGNFTNASDDKTIWDLDPRRKALEDNQLELDQVQEVLEIDVFESKRLGLALWDPRWLKYCCGKMDLPEQKKHGFDRIRARL